ncbi:cupin domain-containing protein [Spirosoma flavum]|uniref:Cupin domain-containing protein n=1 Tax=Spirosoma flavum TaxID=2048557 RepID=A0ABW6AAB0_9BACT
MTAAYYVQTFNMQPHPEGGYFAETYRSAETISQSDLPSRFGGTRSFCTAIYFLLESHHVSAFHRIKSDEIWHFYAGSPLEIFVISSTGELTIIRLGNNPEQGEVFQAVVPAGCWFGSKPAVDSDALDSLAVGVNFSFVGCTVAPGFDFADFDMANRSTLLADFPQHQATIESLTT